MLLSLVSWKTTTQGEKSRKSTSWQFLSSGIESEISPQFPRLNRKYKLMYDKKLKINILIKPDMLKRLFTSVKNIQHGSNSINLSVN